MIQKLKKFFAQHKKYVKNIQLMHISLFAYCTNIASILSSYGTPAEDSYGAPQGEVIRGTINPAINPRLPNGRSTVYRIICSQRLTEAGLNTNALILILILICMLLLISLILMRRKLQDCKKRLEQKVESLEDIIRESKEIFVITLEGTQTSSQVLR